MYGWFVTTGTVLVRILMNKFINKIVERGDSSSSDAEGHEGSNGSDNYGANSYPQNADQEKGRATSSSPLISYHNEDSKHQNQIQSLSG